jgi:polyhydroxyalkanoate synthesis regulator phasin
MTKEEKDSTGEEEPTDGGRGEGIKSGIRQGLGMLSAMKDAIEETLNEARERGDLTPERAKEVMRSTLERAQEKAGEARDALDFVRQKDFEDVKNLVEELQARVSDIEREMGKGAGDNSDSTTADVDGP